MKTIAFLFAVPAVCLALEPALQAAERVTLTNGYDIVCDHHEKSGGKIRLYLRPQQDDFLEVDSEDIAGVADIQDNPPPDGLLTGHSAQAAPAHAGASAGNSADLSPAELHELMARAGARHNLDVDLLASVVRAESGGNAHAVSRAGAQGLMQLMPETAARMGVTDSFRPEENINGGTAYLDALLSRYHDNLALALAAYNAGPEAVDRYHGVPPYRETRVYVARVIRGFNHLKRMELRNRRRNTAGTPRASLSAPGDGAGHAAEE
jgi:hypothetical protein